MSSLSNTRHWLLILALLVIALIPVSSPAAELAASLKDQGARITYHRETGMVNFIGANPAAPIQHRSAGVSALPQGSAMTYAQQYAPLFGLRDPVNELRTIKTLDSPDGRSAVRFQQVHQGVPVIGGEIMVNMDRNRNLLSMGGEVSPTPKVVTQPAVSAADAQATALAAVAKWYRMAPGSLAALQPELSVYDPRLLKPTTQPAHLVWRTEVSNVGFVTVREFVLVDAIKGGISLHFNQIEEAKNRQTYDANSTTALAGTLICDESNPTCTGTLITDAVNAHKYAGDTYDFYLNTHGRDSLDGLGMALISTVRYCPSPTSTPSTKFFRMN